MADAELRVICGPTAAGKSAIGMVLAERSGAIIVSADSRQIYRGFDIGTAKPTAAERARVPHRGIDLIEPTQRFSAAEWARGAEQWIAEASRESRPYVVVGGTGFYIRALTRPLFAQPPLDPERRRTIADWLSTHTTAELRRWCEQLDPSCAALGRAQLLRALEVALLTGIPLSAWHASAARTPRFTARYLLVDPGGELAARIARRVREMFAAGWEDEVASLDRRVPETAPAWNATGYVVMRELVRGRLPREAAVERVVVSTRQYAKRQRTWFRHQLPVADVTPLDPTVCNAETVAINWWERRTA